MGIGEKDTQGNDVTYKVVSTRRADDSIEHAYYRNSSDGFLWHYTKFPEEGIISDVCEAFNKEMLRNNKRIKSIETAFEI
jgi:hypothetical protein